MFIITGARQVGKTLTLLKLAALKGATFLARTNTLAFSTGNMAKKLFGKNKVNIVTTATRRLDKNGNGIVIDDFDMDLLKELIEYRYGSKPIAISFQKDFRLLVNRNDDSIIDLNDAESSKDVLKILEMSVKNEENKNHG